jgi:hypothetical protein
MSPGDRKEVDGDLRTPSNAPGGRVPPPEETPRLPGFRTWRGVYVFVLATFILTIAFLALFSEVYSP